MVPRLVTTEGDKRLQNNQRNPTIAERFDNIIGFFSPQKAFSRKAYRLALRGAEAYENVPAWRNSAGWCPSDGSAEALNSFNRDIARRKARHLERNSEIVNSILNAFERNVVGKGFNLQVRTEDQDWNNLLEELWSEFSRPGNCDVSGKFSLNEILRMIVRRRLVDGGILAIKVINNDMRIPYQIQLAEVDELEGPATLKSPGGNVIIGGIEVNSFGKPLSYYLRKYSFDTYVQLEPERIDAKRVYFLAEHSRPSEVREMTPLVRTLDKIHDLDEFFEAVAFKQKINAAIAVWITTEKDAGPTVGSSLVNGKKESREPGKGERVVPGSVKYLDPGQDIKTLVPGGQSSELADYNLAQLRQISAGHGLSYEMVSRDVSQVNYSSARQNLLEDWKVFEQEQQFLIDHFLNFVFEDVVTTAILSGRIPKGKYPSDFFENREKYLKHEFIGQGLPWIDPYKEALANKIMLETGQTNLKEIFAKKGKDWEEELDQAVDEAVRKLAAGLQQEGETNANQTK